MKKQRFILVFLAAMMLLGGLLVFVPANSLQAADSSWQATYWNNKTLSGSPVLVRNEAELNNDWGDGTPDAIIDKDQFSARWTRSINFPTSSSYRFTATTDDGMRVYVDNVLIIDSWWDSQVHSLSADVYLNAGNHSVKVEYYEAGGKAVAKLSWTAVGGTAPVPIANWKGEYFNNMSLSGNPVLVRDDASINFDWGVGSPGATVVADQFSARWTRSLNFESGRYRFTAQVDDGIRLWVNNQLIINQWVNGNTSYSAEIDLPNGSIPIQMEYFENVGGAVAKLSWVKLSGSGNWTGQYFNNKTLSGSPVLTRNESQVNFNWGSGSPGTAVPSDNFSARWNRTLNFAAGRYRFTATADDGVRMWVNGQLIINGWKDQVPTTYSGEIDLPGGSTPLQVEYYEATGGAQVQVSWTPISTTPTTPATPGPTAGTGTVVSAYLNIRTGPGIQYSIITTLVRNQTVNLTGYRNADANWVQINMSDGTKAWVSGKSYYLHTNVSIANMPVWQGTTPTPTPASGTGSILNAYYVNVRTGPGVSFPVITAVPSGTTVTLLGRNSSTTWLKLRLPNGTVGWMNAYYISNSATFPSLPVLGS
ncbi:PA14 domain-containing protein [Candidatus Leptofilum sp.]|uniref:PA14 domain-containing protein n=1 Tax=Candidatus Leptofilum sp. TaxID=3241576 RepID=UPI003B5996BF